MDLQPQTKNLSDVLKRIDKGLLLLPEFQRPPTWTKSDDEELLRTVARQWPCGVLLWLEGDGGLKFQELADAPKSSSTPEHLLLDGQQRLTAIYRAYRTRGKRVFFVDMGQLVKDKVFKESHLKSEPRAKFAKAYGGLDKNGKSLVATIATLVEDEEWDEWLKYVPDQKQQRKDLIKARVEQLAGFRAYNLYVTVLPANTDLSIVAKIFETLNKTGVRLDVFDLIVAKVFTKQFNLRREWDNALAANAVLADFRVEGLDILRWIALTQAATGGGATGIRQDDVLNLTATSITSTWSQGVTAMSNALSWLRTSCGVKDRAFLPSPTLLLPVALMLDNQPKWRAGFESDLKRWFWASGIEQTYAQGANTRAVSDAKELLAWNSAVSAIPPVLKEARALTQEKIAETLRKPRARNEMLARTMFCDLLARGVRDWYSGSGPLIGEKASLEIHHIIPTAQKVKQGMKKEDRISNLTPLVGSTNQSLGDDHPSVVKANEKIVQSAAEGHGIDWDSFIDAAIGQELPPLHDKRAFQLAGWLKERVK